MIYVFSPLACHRHITLYNRARTIAAIPESPDMSLVLRIRQRQRYAPRYFQTALKLCAILLARTRNSSRRRVVFYPALFVLSNRHFDRDLALQIRKRSKSRARTSRR
jgi:hypothetical protein